MRVGIGTTLGIRKFAELRDDDRLWEETTYLEISGRRIADKEPAGLDLTIYGQDDSRSIADTKGDYALYEIDEHGFRRPKYRTRKGVEEKLYREVRGFGLCGKRRDEDKRLVWSLTLWASPLYVTHMLHLLEMDKPCIVDCYAESEGRDYWMKNFALSNAPEEVTDYLAEDQQIRSNQ